MLIFNKSLIPIGGEPSGKQPVIWTRSMRKKALANGDGYDCLAIEPKPPKSILPVNCKCTHKCTSIFTEEDRLQLFNHFWNDYNSKERRQYIRSNVFTQECKTMTNRGPNTGKRRSRTIRYTFNGQTVCGQFFLKTLHISDARVHRMTLSEVNKHSKQIEIINPAPEIISNNPDESFLSMMNQIDN